TVAASSGRLRSTPTISAPIAGVSLRTERRGGAATAAPVVTASLRGSIRGLLPVSPGRDASGAAPENFGRPPRALGHGLEFSPTDRGMANPGADTAIGPGQHVLPPDQLGIAHQPLGDEIGMLDEVRVMADDAWDEGRALGQLHRLEHPPFMLVAGVGGFDREALCLHAQNDVGDIFQGDIVVMRPVEAAPADMEAYFLGRNAAERMIERLDPQRGI